MEPRVTGGLKRPFHISWLSSTTIERKRKRKSTMTVCECNPSVSFFFEMSIPGPKNHQHGSVNMRAGHLNT